MALLNTFRRAAAELAAARRSSQRFRPHPPVTGLVVEIGGGQSPYPRSDVIIDKYVADDFERPAGSSISFARPLVVGDGERIPIRSNAAVYAIASHVLEHAVSPSTFASELTRIASAGYVEVPSRQAELTFGWPFHPWLIDLDGQVLVFSPRGDLTAPVGSDHHRLFHESVFYSWMHSAHREIWHHAVEWSGALEVRVEGQSEAPQSASFDLEATVSALECASTSYFGRDLVRYLACPECLEHVDLRGASRLACQGCGRDYPFVNNVPILVREAAA